MKNFFIKIWASFYKSDLYLKAKDESASSGVKFILKVSLFVGVLAGVVGLVLFLIFFTGIKTISLAFIEKSFPADLVVTVKDGKLTTNSKDPIIISLPDDEKSKSTEKNILVIVPEEKAEISVLEQYSTYIAITGDGIIAKKSGTEKDFGEIRAYSYQNLNKVFTKDSTLGDVEKVLHYGKIIISIMIIPVLLIGIIISSLLYVLCMFVGALFIWGLLSIRKIDVTYWQSYRMGLYTIVPLMIIGILVFPLNIFGNFLKLIVVLVIIYFATKNWPRKGAVIVPPEQPQV